MEDPSPQTDHNLPGWVWPGKYRKSMVGAVLAISTPTSSFTCPGLIIKSGDRSVATSFPSGNWGGHGREATVGMPAVAEFELVSKACADTCPVFNIRNTKMIIPGIF